MNKKVLFVTYGGGHAHMVYPVIWALRERRPDLAIEVLGLTTAKGILARNGVESFGYSRFLDPAKDADALVWGTELAKEHHSDKNGIELQESVAYLGLSFKDLVQREGEAKARQLMKEKGRHAFLPLTIMERVFDAVRPDFVVTTNSPRSEAAAIATANRRGIGNLAMTDLFSGIGGYTIQAEAVTFLNAFAQDMWVADGLVDPSRSEFHRTGNPAFDKLLSYPVDPDPKWVAREFPAAAGRELILHADAPGYWDPVRKASHFRGEKETLDEMDAVYEAAVQNGGVYLVRPHPSQENALYERWLKGKKDAFLAAGQDLHALLRNASLLVVRTSTVGLEAAYLWKNILQLDADFHSDLPLARMGIAWGATQGMTQGTNGYAGLTVAVRRALSDIQGRQTIQKTMSESLPREPAATKIADIILKKLA